MNPEHRRQLQRIASCLQRLSTEQIDDFYRAELARLYCVELSGVLEILMKDCVIRYAEKTANHRVSSYVSSQIGWFQNPDPEKICGVIRQFDTRWEDQLEAFWKGEIKDAVGSIVGNRHLIAHGRTTSLSVGRISGWLRATQHLAEFLWDDLMRA